MKHLFILFIILTSCIDKKPEIIERCSYPAIPETHIKIFKDSIYVDSLITLIPITETDTIKFIWVNYNDTTDTEIQKKIYAVKKIQQLTNTPPRIIRFWFTSKISATDTTKDFGLFQVLAGDEAIERYRFRLNNENNIIQVSNNPKFTNEFKSYTAWIADTIHLNE